MKVCLISPPYNSAVKSAIGTTSPPLGLAYLASVLRKHHEVKIIDANILDYNFEDVRRELKNFYPDVVGITSVTPSVPQAFATAKIAKEVRKDCTVVMGGSHVTFLPEESLKECEYVDIVVRGEGEKTVEELMKTIERGGSLKKVKGITFRNRTEMVSTEPRSFIKNIDEIPFPSRDLLPIYKYRAYGVVYTTMLTSRGCPFGCSFCASSRLFGKFWRGRSAENVLEEMRIIYEKYKIKNIEFVDDTFTLNKKRVEEICDGMIKEGWDITWGTSSRVDVITKKLAEKMKKAGCWILFLGIESGCQTILNEVGKRITLKQVKKAVKALKDAGIQVLGSFILGFPGETIGMIEKTISFAKKLNLDWAEFSILTPYPGTPLFDYAVRNDLLLTRDWSKFTAVDPIIKLKNVTEYQLKHLFRKAYLSFYLKPNVIWRWIKNRQFVFLKNGIKLVIDYLRGKV